MVKTMLDLTYPITSMFSGAGFNSSISSVFKDRQIEVPPPPPRDCPGSPSREFTVSACLSLDALGPEDQGLVAWVGPSESCPLTGPVDPVLHHHHGHLRLCHAGPHRR